MGPGCVVYQLRYVFKFKLGNCSALGVTNMCLGLVPDRTGIRDNIYMFDLAFM